LMSLIHLFLIHRYKSVSVHYVSPTEDNQYQTERMKAHGIYAGVKTEVGDIIVADVDSKRIAELLEPDRQVLMRLIDKTDPPPA
ncbi:MAG: isocitrate lyase, partial [Gemmatimonadota bacterium]|nr:isocitrate lyase [Gemmatimonadota bacterium]